MKIWDWFCYRRSQWHVERALRAMSSFDYGVAVHHIKAAKAWERSRPALAR